ncbi:class I SAM-dependent methyltransferase [Flavobacterium sp.]|uniref:class I SAM-dependent methyltransferase n=1 Tax=Flavobacterium sp. TaxID=239 RepID=UPI003C6868BB
MNEEEIKLIASQLRKPKGEYAKKVGVTMNEGNLLMNKKTIALLDAQPNETILEIGMGNGLFVKDILSIDSTICYIGCDFSDVMVQESISNNQIYVANSQAQFIEANINKLPQKPSTVDKLFTVNTLYFWDDVSLGFSEIKRVLKDKGQLILSIRPKSVMDDFPITKYGFTTFSKLDAVEILTQNGFEINEIVEEEEEELDFFGGKLKNGFLVFKATKL